MANSENNLLHTRTADGLPLTLGLSFQYRYMPEHIHALYLRYKGEHHQVYVNKATAAIANIACNYTAYAFFNDKQGIAVAMQRTLNQIFVSHLFAQVEALQINQVELPSSFQDAILESISTKQNITRSERFKEGMEVGGPTGPPTGPRWDPQPRRRAYPVPHQPGIPPCARGCNSDSAEEDRTLG